MYIRFEQLKLQSAFDIRGLHFFNKKTIIKIVDGVLP
jgi:hypothetical protein